MKKMIGTMALGLAIAGSLSATGVTTAEPVESNAQAARMDCVEVAFDAMECVAGWGWSDSAIMATGNNAYAACEGW